MSIKDSLLAILTQGPCYGYQLGYEFDARTGGAVPLNTGQIYTTLDRLQNAKMVEDGGLNREGQSLYRITESGRTHVRSWLSTPITHEIRRNELATKLSLAISLPQVDVIDIIQRQRSESIRSLQELTRLKGEAMTTDLAWELLLDAHLFEIESEIRWLDHCETKLARARRAGVDPSFPLNPTPPRRGRPARTQTFETGAGR